MRLKIPTDCNDLYHDNLDLVIKYLTKEDRKSRLLCNIGSKVCSGISVLMEKHKDPLLHITRLKRIKKQLITYCLKLLSLEWNEGVLALMRRISNPKHCWRIVQDKSLSYSQEFVNKIFYEN